MKINYLEYIKTSNELVSTVDKLKRDVLFDDPNGKVADANGTSVVLNDKCTKYAAILLITKKRKWNNKYNTEYRKFEWYCRGTNTLVQ